MKGRGADVLGHGGLVELEEAEGHGIHLVGRLGGHCRIAGRGRFLQTSHGGIGVAAEITLPALM